MRRRRRAGADLSRRDAARSPAPRGRTRSCSKASARADRSASRARFVVDATGPRGFLHHALGLEESPLRWLPPTQGLYTHFEASSAGIGCSPAPATPPYPVDDAALHHVFPGGWIWMLRFNNGLTSAGAALTDAAAARIEAPPTARAAWDRLLATLPSVRGAVSRTRAPTLPFVHAPRLAFRSARVAGPIWALLPSAAGVIDPLLSTGFPLTLLGIVRLLDLLERTSPGPEREAALPRYERTTLARARCHRTARRRALRDDGRDPPLFKRLSLLYFAAASFSEAARRLGKPGAGAGIPAQRAPDVRSGAGRVRGGWPRRRPAGQARRDARSAHRSRDRAVRHRRSSRSPASRLVSGARVGPPGVAREAARDTARDRRTPRTHRHDPGRDLTRGAAIDWTRSRSFSTRARPALPGDAASYTVSPGRSLP